MNFKTQESSQKLRGGFYTNPTIADFLVRWVGEIKPSSILEPSCGDGAFLPGLNHYLPKAKIVACELDKEEAAKAKKKKGSSTEIKQTDFLQWYLNESKRHRQFDAVVGNPPFIRYQYLEKDQQLLAEQIFAKLDIPFTKHANAWVTFVVASLDLLKEGGRLGMVIPSEIFHIPHAQGLRSYLANKCSRVLIIDPQELWFEDALQGTVLLLAEKQAPGAVKTGVGIASVTDRSFLDAPAENLFTETPFSTGVATDGKWMKLFLTQEERELMATLRNNPKIKRFDEVASVDVGIVTGANDFFLISDEEVLKNGLTKWAHPMFGRSNHVKGLVFTKQDHIENKKQGLAANFIWLTGEKSDFSEKIRKYLSHGEELSLHTRYKCRIRTPWFTVPSVYTTPVAMLKRAHHFPRLVLNSARAYTTDTAYRISPTDPNTATDLVFSFVNSLTLLSAELEGRHYGGGVLELVPSEIERLLIPLAKANISQLMSVDKTFRKMPSDDTFVASQDALVLTQIGITKKQQTVLHAAWNRLRRRRQRETEDLPAED
jgi:adenine-specific DNA-methyltransferase